MKDFNETMHGQWTVQNQIEYWQFRKSKAIIIIETG